MNLRLSTIFLLIGLFSLMGMTCKLTHYNPELYKKPVILFGEGGGFSGKETTYALIKKGYLFKKVGSAEEYELVRTVPVENCRSIFKKVKALSPAMLRTQQAGNMYQFMEVEVEKETYRMVWGNEGKPVDPELKALYKELIGLYQQEM